MILSIICLQELIDRDVWVFCIGKEMRKLMLQTTIIPHIRPEKGGFSIPHQALCNSFKNVNQFQMSFPPKGSLQTSSREFTITVISVPYKVNPRDILVIVKFIQILQNKCRVLNIKVKRPQSPMVLGSTDFLPCYKSLTLSLNIRCFLSPQALPHILNQLIFNSDRKFKAVHIINGKGR